MTVQTPKHSNIVGGSTAKRVINCPGSVALVAQSPIRDSSTYADRGTLLHNAITEILDTGCEPESLTGMTYESEVLTDELVLDKLFPALAALEEIDPDGEMEIATETVVSFGEYMPGVFGSADLLGYLPSIKRAVVLDWKFGDGVVVEAEENPQGMFYTAAGLRTPAAAWVFENAVDVEIIIVQPPAVKRWVTNLKRIRTFELQLKRAVKASEKWDAPLKQGDWCRFCPAKPTCPLFTGAVDRALKIQVEAVDRDMVGKYLGNADLLEIWIKDLRALAFEMLGAGVAVPGWKLVEKRGTRKWIGDELVMQALLDIGATADEYMEPSTLKSPAQVEKALKPRQLVLPEGLTKNVSSGNTLAPESDTRPPALLLGQQLTAALSKIA